MKIVDSIFSKLIQNILHSILIRDLKLAKVKSGNINSIKKYMNEKHPFYSEKNHNSLLSNSMKIFKYIIGVKK